MNFTAHKQQEVIAASVTGNNKLRQVMHVHVAHNHSRFNGNQAQTSKLLNFFRIFNDNEGKGMEWTEGT